MVLPFLFEGEKWIVDRKKLVARSQKTSKKNPPPALRATTASGHRPSHIFIPRNHDTIRIHILCN
jgi:hypothetical protein